jgi:hypothetical protein
MRERRASGRSQERRARPAAPDGRGRLNAVDRRHRHAPHQRCPVNVAQEMYRVCRPGGRVIILNHFLSPNRFLSRIERWISPATIHIGFKADLDLPAFLAQAELNPVSIEKVNWPRIWSLVTVVK